MFRTEASFFCLIMNKHILSKSTFIRGVQCLRSLYFHKHRSFLRDRMSKEQLAKFKHGTKVGVIAQDLFPGGINLKPKSPSQYQKCVINTKEVINSSVEKIIYEAGFQYDGVLVLLDILVKNENKMLAYEVKSSGAISDTFILDAALQYYVISNSGIKLDDFFIIYVDKSKSFEDTDKLESIFIKESVLDKVIKKQDFIKDQIIKEKETLLLPHSPGVSPGKHCFIPYPCDFIGHCWKKIDNDYIKNSAELNENNKDVLMQKGIL